MVFLSRSESVQVFNHLFMCIDPVKTRGESLDPVKTTGESLDPINLFNPTTLLCLSQARTWISNVIYHGIFLCSVSEDER